MGRKYLALIVVLSMLLIAGSAMAAEKVDNVFIVGADVGYFGHTGWLGDNFSGGPGFDVFFGYGIVDNFAIQLDYIPLIMASPTGDDVKDLYDKAGFGGVGMDGGQFGGFGLSGKLYPRGRFRDADFVIVQPVINMGFGLLPFVWTYKSGVSPDDYDGVNNIYVNLGGGVDFMLAKWISLGINLKLWKYFVPSETLQGYTVDSTMKSDIGDSFTYQAGVGVTFQW